MEISLSTAPSELLCNSNHLQPSKLIPVSMLYQILEMKLPKYHLILPQNYNRMDQIQHIFPERNIYHHQHELEQNHFFHLHKHNKKNYYLII